MIGLIKTKILMPEKNSLKKLTTYIPENKADMLLQKMHEVGGGKIGNYEECSFKIDGTGSYKGNKISNPYRNSQKSNEKTLFFCSWSSFVFLPYCCSIRGNV